MNTFDHRKHEERLVDNYTRLTTSEAQKKSKLVSQTQQIARRSFVDRSIINEASKKRTLFSNSDKNATTHQLLRDLISHSLR